MAASQLHPHRSPGAAEGLRPSVPQRQRQGSGIGSLLQLVALSLATQSCIAEKHAQGHVSRLRFGDSKSSSAAQRTAGFCSQERHSQRQLGPPKRLGAQERNPSVAGWASDSSVVRPVATGQGGQAPSAVTGVHAPPHTWHAHTLTVHTPAHTSHPHVHLHTHHTTPTHAHRHWDAHPHANTHCTPTNV